MKKLSLDLSKTTAFLNDYEIEYMEEAVKAAHDKKKKKKKTKND